MHIREAARRSGVSAATIRYYEQRGLLGRVGRTASGYRVFSDRDIRLLEFLRRARELGFSLEECAELVDLVATPDRASSDNVRRTRKLAEARLQDIDEQMADLQRRRDLIQQHVDSLRDEVGDCPVSGSLQKQP